MSRARAHLLFLVFLALAGCGITYRIDDDRVLAAVNGIVLRPGDRLALRGGMRFQRPLTLGVEDRGSRWRPIVIESDGAIPAVIDGGPGSAIILDGVSHLLVRNVHVIGAGRRDGNLQGVGVLIRDSSHIRIDRVTASGFQRAGVEIMASNDIRLTRIEARDNGYAGICSSGGRSRNIHIGRCRAINNPGDPTILDNHSGSGIVLMNIERALIEHCEAAENGWDMPRTGNGPVGIWCAFADRVVIQHCVSHHNKSPGLDGGGFDFDGAVTNSVMRYNRSHDNSGYGYLLYEFGSGLTWGNNIIHHCVSENDGEGGIGIGVSENAPPGTTLGRCNIHHNTVRTTPGKPAVHFFEGDAGEEVRITGNLFITDGPAILGPHRAILRHNRHRPPVQP
jgi:hypothetical protein